MSKATGANLCAKANSVDMPQTAVSDPSGKMNTRQLRHYVADRHTRHAGVVVPSARQATGYDESREKLQERGDNLHKCNTGGSGWLVPKSSE